MDSKTVFILCHSDGRTAGLQTLREYLAFKGYEKLELLHPLDDYGSVDSTFQRSDGETITIPRKSGGIWNLFLDFFISVKYIRQEKFAIFIGASNFDTIPAIFCRKILRKKIDKIIYYPRDFSPSRYRNRLMNTIYMGVEKIACEYSDLTANNTKRAEAERMKLGLKGDKSVILPNSINLHSNIAPKKFIKNDEFIYIGDVSVEHGLYDLVKTIHPLIKKLVIMGRGNDWDRIVELTESLGIKTELHYEQSKKAVAEYLSGFEGFGLAPYNNHSRWTYFCSPLKVGEYISYGVPVLMSSVPEIADEVVSKSYGIIYNQLNLKTIQKSLDNFNSDKYELRAKQYYDKFNFKAIMGKLQI